MLIIVRAVLGAAPAKPGARRYLLARRQGSTPLSLTTAHLTSAAGSRRGGRRRCRRAWPRRHTGGSTCRTTPWPRRSSRSPCSSCCRRGWAAPSRPRVGCPRRRLAQRVAVPPSLRLAVAVAVAMVLRAVTVVTVAMGSRTGPTARGGWPGVVWRAAQGRGDAEREGERWWGGADRTRERRWRGRVSPSPGPTGGRGGGCTEGGHAGRRVNRGAAPWPRSAAR